jgi:hypothetical protein
MEILNDRGYAEDDPQRQSVVWERMNLPIARGLRGLLYVLWDLSQVDPSDLSMLFGGAGRMRIGFSELNPAAGQEPGDDDIKTAVRGCWENPYCAFTGVPGTSLVCIAGDWSNVTDGKIKGALASLALGASPDSPYNPLYARATSVPRPWGITTIFSEYTGTHAPLEIDWVGEKRAPWRVSVQSEDVLERPAVSALSDVQEGAPVAAAPPAVAITANIDPVRSRPAFTSVWDFARAVNRSDPAALELAGNGGEPEVSIDAGELRKLVGTFWFRSVFPRLSTAWRRRMLDVLLEHVSIPDHVVRTGRRSVRLSELSLEQRRQLVAGAALPDEVRADLQLLVTVARFWGEEAANGFALRPVPEGVEPSGLASLLQPFRHS